MSRAIRGLVILLAATFVLPAFAQRHRDPLNDKEVDELREAAQDPPKRMKLLISFVKARMEAIEHMRSDPKVAGENGAGIQKLLADVAALMDELDDNLDMYNQRTEDLRKPLKTIIEMDSDLQLKLRAIKETATPEDLRNYGVALEDATDSVNESADSARSMLADQVAKRGKAKETDKDDEKQDKKKKTHGDDSETKPPCSPC